MEYGFGPMVKHLNNLITRKSYSMLNSPEYANMSYANLQVVELIYESSDSVTQKDIEQSLKINRATTSKMLKLMEEKGYIIRSEDGQDSRRKQVILTEKGKQYYLDNEAVIRELDDWFHTILTYEEMEHWKTIYNKMITALTE